MNKKLIIIAAAAGLISFAGSFALAWFTAEPAVTQTGRGDETTTLDGATASSMPDLRAGPEGTVKALDAKVKKSMTQKRLKGLVYKVRDKLHEYDSNLQNLKEQEQRLQIAHNLLKEDIEKLGALQVELNLAIGNLRDQQAKLEKSRVTIAQTEKENLMTIAATYDKMNSTSASKILVDMSKMQTTQQSNNME